MAQGGVVLDRDQFNCSICLDVLKEPVTIPCGHSYCSGCIQRYWDQGDNRGVYDCPQCRQTFNPRPHPGRNTILAEVVEKLRNTSLHQRETSAAPARTKQMVVFFDLETTGLDTDRCHILQLAAIGGTRKFNKFVSPYRDIDSDASRINGFTTHRRRGRRSLRLHGQPVDTVPIKEAITDFIDFLRSFHGPLLLAAHNARRFDRKVLIRCLERLSLMEDFLEVVDNVFLDTLYLSRELFPSFSSHKLRDLARRNNMSYDAHDAQEDVRVLQKLYKKWKPNWSTVQRCTYPW